MRRGLRSLVEFERWHPALIVAIASGGLVVMSLVVSWIAAFGRGIDGGFYGAASEIIPVLLLAMMVEVAFTMSTRDSVRAMTSLERTLERGKDVLDRKEETDATRDLARTLAEIRDGASEARQELRVIARGTRGFVYAFFCVAAIGEAGALYAMAAAETTTFLFVLTAGAIGELGLLLAAAYSRRFPRPESSPDSEGVPPASDQNGV